MKKLQAFVSSTYLDLRPERQAVVEGVLRAGHIPAGMELFVAGDRSQWQTIKTWIGISDVLILLLGGRYGSIEPDSGRSYTHLEYLHAESLGIPTIGIVLNDSFLASKQASGEGWTSEQHLGEYIEFRQHVMSKLCAPVNDTKDIQLEVGRSLFEVSSDSNRVGWIRANELPSDPSLLAEVKTLKNENQVLKTKVKALLESVPEDRAVQTALELLSSQGLHTQELKNKSWVQGPFYYLDAWFILIGNTLAKHPHHLTMGHQFLYYQVAPHLANYGLLKRAQTESPGFGPNPKPIQWTHYELTELGSRVFSELQRRQSRQL